MSYNKYIDQAKTALPQFSEKGRLNLGEAIPLSTPLTMFIDITGKCNLRCRFCFQHLLKNYPQKHMTKEVFSKIVSDTKQFPNKIKLVNLHCFGEPMTHPDLPQFIRIIREELSDRVRIFSNGTLLPMDGPIEAVEAGLTHIKISINAMSSERYLEVTGVRIDFDKLVNRITNLYNHRKDCFVEVKLLDTNLTENDKEVFFKTFIPITDFCHIENVLDIYGADPKEFNLAGHQVNYEDAFDGRICPSPFYTLVIRANSDVVACVKDCSTAVYLGNVETESIVDIWNGKRMHSFFKSLLQQDYNKIPICKDCSDKAVYHDNIDNYSDEILHRLNSRGEMYETRFQ